MLLDELGSGTDPVEGAALAEAIIDRLKQSGAKLMVTTHYQELKIYATEQQDVENASCEFDIQKLRPTYRLIVGSVGKSNAFAISAGLGMPQDIIRQAEKLVSEENTRFEQAVSRLDEARKALEDDRETMRAALEEAKENAAKLRAELEQTRRERDRQLEQARLEAMHIIETTKAQSNEMLTELEQLRKQKEKASFGDDVIRAKGDVKRGFRKLYDTANPLTDTAEDEDYVLPRELKSGDTVMLADTKQKGVVLGKPDKNGNVFLQMGAMRSKVPVGRLRLVSGAEEKKKSQQKKQANFPAAFLPTVPLLWQKVIGILSEQFMAENPGVSVTYDPTGSGTGIEAASNGSADIGLSSRALKDEEASAGLEGTTVALDGIAIIVNAENPVEDMSVEQIAQLFTGAADWSLVGGEGEVACIGREAGSGTRDGF